MAKKKNPESTFDGGGAESAFGAKPFDTLLSTLLGSKGRSIGDMLIFAGKVLKELNPRKSTDGIDQQGKPVRILMCETLLDGGSQDWAMIIDKNSVRFIVDYALDSKTQGHIYLLSHDGRKKLEYGGAGERKIIDALKRWLNQFWTEIEQASIAQYDQPNAARVEGENPDDIPYPWCAVAATKLIAALQGRQKKGKS